MNDMRKRLIELLQEYTDDNNGGGSNYGLADHLIENGVVLPPCEVGDIVYAIRKDTKVIYTCSVCEFIINKHFDNIHIECKVYIIDDNRFTYFEFSSFGVNVFFTKEQAEQKLKESEVTTKNEK